MAAGQMAGAAGVPVSVTRILADPVRMYLPSRYWNKARDWFSYNLDFNTLAAGAVGQEATFTVQNDSDFLVLAVNVQAATAAAGTTELAYLPFLMQVRDTGSSANWFDSFTHIQNVTQRVQRDAAGAVAPCPLEIGRLIVAASSVTVQLTNLDGANARRVWLSFRGVKVYRKLAEQQ